MAKIYIHSWRTKQMFEMPTFESAACAALHSKGDLIVKLDLSDENCPDINEDSVIYTYIPAVVKIGNISFRSRYGWMHSVHPKGDNTPANYTGDFVGRNDLIDALDNNERRNLWVYIWPIGGDSLPLGTNNN